MKTENPENPNGSIIVTDAGPLVTLAEAGALDALLLPGVRVVIPDMVRFEVLHHFNESAAREIMDWVRKNEPEKVYVGTTETFDEFILLRKVIPKIQIQLRSQESASEIFSRKLDGSVILLLEDREAKRKKLLARLPDRVVVRSTTSFLERLETKHLTDNAKEILEA